MSLENNNNNNNNGQIRNNKSLLALYIFQKITKKHLVAVVVYFSRCLLVTLSTILSALIFKAIFRTFLIETINLNCRFFSFFSFLPFLNFSAITFLTYQVPKKTSEGVKFTIYLLFFFFSAMFSWCGGVFFVPSVLYR